MNAPLVSVVCVCYNHERFVREAIESVRIQNYSNIQLIVVDDHSTDNSVDIIQKALLDFPSAQFIAQESNQGNCRAFNRGFEKALGEFIIDLSADDVLYPERITKGVLLFQTHGEETGVIFSDAALIDENGKRLGYHSDRFPHHSIPQGDIYRDIISRYFINSPTMMMRRQVFEKLRGYDESLAYEDFDFWVRSAREFKYAYSAEPLIKRRILPASLGKGQYKKGNRQLRSTWQVCKKVAVLNKKEEENDALRHRVWHEIRRALRLGEFKLVRDYWRLHQQIH